MSSEIVKTFEPLEPARGRSMTTVVRIPGGSQRPEDGKEVSSIGQKLPLSKATEPVEESALNEAVSNLNDYVQNMRRDLHFSVDKDSGRTVIKVLDSETKEVIRQIPPEEVLALARDLGAGDGVLLREQA